MIKILFPENFINEREYCIDVIFSEFLGIQFNTEFNRDSTESIIILENGNKLVLKDHFFSKFKGESEYLNANNIPTRVDYIKNDFLSEDDLPLLYGLNEIKLTDNEIVCEIDVFASVFFMLSRWEEHISEITDEHGRFPDTHSLAIKNGFAQRPVVNEYIEFLWKMLQKLGCQAKRRNRNFEVSFTHDVDLLFKLKPYGKYLKSLGGDLLKRRSLNLMKESTSKYNEIKKGTANDPYDNFDYFMDLAEKNGVKSHFFFMAGGSSKYENFYDIENPDLIPILKKIIEREHIIGIHPSYNTFDNKTLFQSELKKLENICGKKILCGRQHFLRLKNPDTLQIWEESGMEWDSTIGYSDHYGFRSGTCYEYSIFDVIKRRKMNLREKPLLFMDTTMMVYKSRIGSVNEELIIDIRERTKKYNGNFVMLWHNSNVNDQEWVPYKDFLQSLLTE